MNLIAIANAFASVAGNTQATNALANALGSGNSSRQTALTQLNAYQMDTAQGNLVGAQMALSALMSIQGLPSAVAPQLAILASSATDASAKATAVAAIQTALAERSFL